MTFSSPFAGRRSPFSSVIEEGTKSWVFVAQATECGRPRLSIEFEAPFNVVGMRRCKSGARLEAEHSSRIGLTPKRFCNDLLESPPPALPPTSSMPFSMGQYVTFSFIVDEDHTPAEGFKAIVCVYCRSSFD